MSLGAGRDALGRPQVRLDWRLNPLDKRSAGRSLEIIGHEIAAAGLGQFHITLTADDSTWPLPLRGGAHHMGTTRMHVDPRQGVVDENCKVHDVANLYIAGSSVFPTGGYANPTLTLCALALRLADRVKNEMHSLLHLHLRAEHREALHQRRIPAFHRFERRDAADTFGGKRR